MSFKMTIPPDFVCKTDEKGEERDTRITLTTGNVLFLLGANGTGKSSLMHKLFAENKNNSTWISAHRQNWFQSSSVTLTPDNNIKYQTQFKDQDTKVHSRYKDHVSTHRIEMALFGLVEAVNNRARRIAEEHDNGKPEQAAELAKEDAPHKIINELLKKSNIPITISIENNSLIQATKSGCKEPYGVDELSDGERNALLISSSILTVEPGTLILIDEPERHLHRSIISPLLIHLFSKRTDCVFIVSTHEVQLPIDIENSKTLLIRGCSFVGKTATTWETDLLPAQTVINDYVKKDILGSRRKIIFVEGEENSLDKALYNLLFDNVSVIAKSSCTDVEDAVVGIRSSKDLHWLEAWGIIDNDRRPYSELNQLIAKGIHTLDLYSVESIYYHPEIQKRVATRKVVMSGGDVNEKIELATVGAIQAIQNSIDHLCSYVVDKKVRRALFSNLPLRVNMTPDAPPFEISIPVQKYLRQKNHVSMRQ
jgi:ABC-type cobalamin/Fe3+-siderophores transport system ATPase subunit